LQFKDPKIDAKILKQCQCILQYFLQIIEEYVSITRIVEQARALELEVNEKKQPDNSRMAVV